MKVSDLLSSPEKWTRGTQARNSNGLATTVKNPDATCWCLIGALAKVYCDDPLDVLSVEEIKPLYKAIEKRGYDSIAKFNDNPNTTFEMVREVVLEAGI